MQPLILYKMDASPPARAVMMLGDILNLKFQYREKSTLTGNLFEPEYLAINPMHTIPLLEDREFILADSHAIATYLITKYGGDKKEALYPSDFQKRAIVNQRLYFDTGILFPRMRAVVYSTLKLGGTGPDEIQTADIEDGYGILERYLQSAPYIAGENMTVADVCAVATVSTLNLLVPIDSERFPHVNSWMKRLAENEWYQERNVPGLQRFERIKAIWQKNLQAS